MSLIPNTWNLNRIQNNNEEKYNILFYKASYGLHNKWNRIYRFFFFFILNLWFSKSFREIILVVIILKYFYCYWKYLTVENVKMPFGMYFLKWTIKIYEVWSTFCGYLIQNKIYKKFLKIYNLRLTSKPKANHRYFM